MHYIIRADNWVFKTINTRFRCSLLNTIMPYLTHMGGAVFTITLCLILLFLNTGIGNMGKSAVIALAGSHFIVQVIKKFVNRQRPYLVLDQVNIWDKMQLKDYSFPSGHTTASFALATVLSMHSPILTPVLMAFAAFVGFSRIYLGLHYPTDVVIGAGLGISAGIMACL